MALNTSKHFFQSEKQLQRKREKDIFQLLIDWGWAIFYYFPRQGAGLEVEQLRFKLVCHRQQIYLLCHSASPGVQYTYAVYYSMVHAKNSYGSLNSLRNYLFFSKVFASFSNLISKAHVLNLDGWVSRKMVKILAPFLIPSSWEKAGDGAVS